MSNNCFFNCYIRKVWVMGEGSYHYILTDNPELNIYGVEKLESKNEYGYTYIAYKEEFRGPFGWIHDFIDGGLFGWGREIIYSGLDDLYVRGLLEMEGIEYTMLESGMQFGVHQ
jgi:hypothetical protein